MTTRSQIILLVLAISIPVALSAVAPAVGGGGLRVGGYLPIKNLSAPEVQEAAKFAVSEFNKKSSDETNSKALLQYGGIVKGEYQVVSGIKYRLVVSAKSGESDGKYEAVVYSKPWQHFKQLLSFKKVQG